VRSTGAQDRQLLTPLRAADEQQQPSAFDYEEPETAKEGIDLGLVMCKQGRWVCNTKENAVGVGNQ
jgi:hypothetical protein